MTVSATRPTSTPLPVLPLLQDKIALITGASQGIGAVMARYFADAGARVVIAARSGDKLAALADDIGRERALPVVADVTDEEAVRAMVETAVREFGRLDVAVNNAGGGHRPIPAADLCTEEFDASFATNLRGVFLAMKYEVPAMLEAGGGAIVNVSSAAGERGTRGLAAYSATKHGLAGLTKTAALDYAARGVRINAIAPGPIATAETEAWPVEYKQQAARANPMQRMGTSEEVAALAAWLASDYAGFITGAVVPVDGGLLAGEARLNAND